ncbi:MAG: thioesterase family protein [Marmoricola sp.]
MPRDHRDPTTFGLFRREGDLLVPQDMARSLWKADQMHGVATSGALGRAVEQAALARGRDDVQPARFTVDLFRAPSMDACTTRTEVLREGPRILVIDAELVQGDEPVARARALFLKPGETPSGTVWADDDVPQPPPLEVAPISDDPHVPFFYSDAGWSQNFAVHQNAGRKRMWQTTLPVVIGEETTPFQGLAGAADSTSMVVNWGSQGVQHINTDITLSISRLPASREVGLSALAWTAHEGIATGTVVLYDRQGPLGTSTVTSLANAKRSVDFTSEQVLGEIGLA